MSPDLFTALWFGGGAVVGIMVAEWGRRTQPMLVAEYIAVVVTFTIVPPAAALVLLLAFVPWTKDIGR